MHPSPENSKLKSILTRSRVTILLLLTLGVMLAVQMVMSPVPTTEDIFIRSVLWISVILAWSSWLWRAYGNLNEVFDLDTKRSKKMAVLHHFIPLLNIVKPYEVFVELWSLSASPPKHTHRALLRTWWGGWLLCWIYYRRNTELSRAMTDTISQTALTILDICFLPAICVLAAYVIWSITLFQLERGQLQQVSDILE